MGHGKEPPMTAVATSRETCPKHCLPMPNAVGGRLSLSTHNSIEFSATFNEGNPFLVFLCQLT
ncbi:hypothetical protein [Nostoc sp. DedQUE04]|uniref:hypothetical protein n=1 Tax=Nostoc sp. DedQUE04 TaxID=3075390 RepID=UPI002AD397A6|nr:hypothetical protein [Nostoc sp. DedQUE04]